MIQTVRSEWIKLRTVRSNIVMVGIAILIPVAIVLLTVSFIDIFSVTDVTLTEVIAGSGTMSVMVLGVVGVLCVTQEYSQGTIRLTLAATSSRLRVYGSKLVVVATLAAMVMLIVIAVCRTLGAAILEGRDVTTVVGYDGEFAVYGAMVVVAMLVAMLGCAAGTLTRNPPGAISSLLLWPLVVEGIVGGVLSLVIDGWKQDWLPFQSGLSGLQVSVYDLEFGRWGAIGYFALWVLAVTLLAVRLLKRRDA